MTDKSTLVLVAVGALTLVGCDDPPPKQAPEAKDAGAPTSALDPKLQKAMESAAARSSAAAPAGTDRPPQAGVFGPGVADQIHRSGAPVRITMITSGEGDKQLLLPKLELQKPVTVVLTPVNQMGPRSHTPKVVYTLELKTVAEDKDKKGAAPEGGSPPAAPSLPTVVATIKKVDNQDKQNVPEKAAKAIEKLVGARISGRLTAVGSLAEVTFKVPDDAQGVTELLHSLVQSVELVFSPMPSEPVGAGAQWIAHDRTTLQGIDVLRYRVTKVEKMAGDEVAFKVDIRHYAASESSLPAGVPPGSGLVLLQFDSFGHAVYTRKVGGLVPTSAQAKVPFAANFGKPGMKQGGARLDVTLLAELSRPPAK